MGKPNQKYSVTSKTEYQNTLWYVQSATPGLLGPFYKESDAVAHAEILNRREAIKAAGDDMLKALRLADRYLNNTLHGRKPGINAIKLSQAIRAAIAKAEGGAE